MLMIAILTFSSVIQWSIVPASAQAADSQLTIVTQDSGGSQISGYYTTLMQNGNFIAAGFSPATFSVAAGQSYVVSVQDYGSYVFDHWQDTGSKVRDRDISISSASQIMAVYKNVNDPGPTPSPTPPPSDGGQSKLAVRSQDSAGNRIDGYYTTLSQGGSVIKADFTVASFTLDNGQPYTVTVHDYGQYAFDHWSDTGSKTKGRAITISQDTSITAVYRNVNGDPAPTPDPTPSPDPSPAPSGQSSLTVTTFDSHDVQINGYYTTLSKSGQTLKTGFSPVTFTLDNGQNYVVAVQDYGSYAFDHWKDTGSKTRDRTITITSNTQLAAVYRNINEPEPSPTPTPDPTPSPDPSPTTRSLVKASSGLVMFDSLIDGNFNRQQLESNNPNGWTYYGSASVQNAPIDYYENTTDGLTLGVQSLGAGQWAGLFAVTPDLDAQLYHALLTIPYDAIKDNSFDTGLYVQTTNGLINYVTCAAMVTPSGNFWAVVRTTGNFDQATEFETLWRDSSSGQPNTRDCTIITNGNNFLQVYMDKTLVVSQNDLDLKMPPPFNAFLEVQTSSPTQMLFGTYMDFYATKNSMLDVADAPAGGTVKVVKPGSSTAIASGAVGSDGHAKIDLGKNHFPLAASVQVYDSGSHLIASTDAELWAGDVYRVSG
jgi:hypothetical protein